MFIPVNCAVYMGKFLKTKKQSRLVVTGARMDGKWGDISQSTRLLLGKMDNSRSYHSHTDSKKVWLCYGYVLEGNFRCCHR